jgi:hypothetical protein
MPPEDHPPTLDYANPERQFGWGRLILLVSGIIVVLVLGLALLPSLNRVRVLDPRVESASNLRQIGLAIMQYSNDNQGAFPDSFQTILLNEDITSQAFVSPLSNDTPATGPTTQATVNQLTAGGHCSYVYLGQGLSIATATPKTMLAYEPPSASGGGIVLFGDFHVELLSTGEFAKLLAKAAAGKLPVTAPSN